MTKHGHRCLFVTLNLFFFLHEGGALVTKKRGGDKRARGLNLPHYLSLFLVGPFIAVAYFCLIGEGKKFKKAHLC